ncbi:MAG: hypothetical protein ACRBF0_00195 [Calditrichia bacterium]
MLSDNSALIKMLVAILFFPTFFQDSFLAFAWGSSDDMWIMLAKRCLLLLPVAAIIFACWLTVACMLTVLVRQNRQQFITLIFITWWDMGKSIVAFWGGVVRFLLYLVAALVGLIKITVMGILSILHDTILLPFRVLRQGGQHVLKSSVPWVAVVLTLFWCFIEAIIFTYVTTPLVIDTFSNITGEQLSETMIRIPLFIFMLLVILGSYAVLANFLEVVKSKNIPAILGVLVIEVVVLMVEVLFLYREFVDALVPWFAQYSDNFELGLFSTLAIAALAWFGIRSLSWFLFAAHGTPVILSMIQGRGVEEQETGSEKNAKKAPEPKPSYTEVFSSFLAKIRSDISWVEDKGEHLLSTFMLPPLQIVAAAINFCALLINGKHLFELPFKSISEIGSANTLMKKMDRKEQSLRDA